MADLVSQLSAALVGRYLIERELGHGGMATVYLARDLKHDRLVAVKVLHPELSATLGTDRFLREIHVTARLDHPHILPVLDSGETSGLLWYTMPYVEGETLRDRLRRETQLPVREAFKIIREVADALDYAHRHQVIHRDIKPENILLADDHARVADFGVARALEAAGGEELTGTGLAVGTPTYMSPEQATGGRLDARSDIYALGCVLYEVLTGEPPFTGPTPQAVIAKRLVGPVPSVRTTRPDVAPALDEALHKALEPVPAARFSTAGEFAQAISEAHAPQSGTGAETSIRLDRSRRHRIRQAAIGIGTLSVLALGAGGLLWRSRSAPYPLDANLLAVAPFDILDPKLELWREGLVDLLARNLDGAGPIRTVPPTAVIRRWSGRADQLAASELSRRTGAQLILYGSLVPAGSDSVRLRATLLDVTRGRSLAELELRDVTVRIDRLTDSLTIRLLDELGRNRRIELSRVASLGSTSLPALKAFLQGEQWFRRTAWDSALASYERAVALDSTFCLALWRLGHVIGWQRSTDDSLSIALTLRAGRLNRGLAARDSLLVTVDSILASDGPWTWGLYRRLSGTAREAVARYPDDAGAWHSLGEVYVHRGIDRGATASEALAAFDRAIALDSAYAPAYIHAITLASYSHGLDAGRPYALEYLRRASGDETAEGIRLGLDLADPARAHSPEVVRALARASASVLVNAWSAFMGVTDSGEVAIRLARALAASPDSAPLFEMEVRRSTVVISLLYRGHLEEASAAWSPGRGMFGASSQLAGLSLLSDKATDIAVVNFSEQLRVGHLGKSQAGLVWWTSRGDSSSIRRFERLADSLARSSPDSSIREQGVYGVAAAGAYLALVRGDSSEALTRFEALPDSLCRGCTFESLTRLLLRSARRQDRKVVETPWPFYYPSVRDVVARLEQARAAERLGERERAVRGYRFVAEVWQHADPELQPYVAEARGAIKTLTREPQP